MKKTFVLDTTVLLHDPQALYKFQDNHIVLPIVVLEEVDKFKRDQSEVGRNARTVSRYLDKEREKGSLSNGVTLEGGGRLTIALDSEDILKLGNQPKNVNMSNDNWILGVALRYAKEHKDDPILVTKDVNLRIKADALNVRAEDYSNDKVTVDELYTGFTQVSVSAETLLTFRKLGFAEPPQECFANQFVIMVDENDGATREIGRYDDKVGKIVPLKVPPDLWGVVPRNLEQELAIELLLNRDIKLVTLVGKAGTGKTLLALAAGLQLVVDDGHYHRLMVGRPIHPLGKDLGYLPGDIDEKIRPWMQPIFDNLEYILHCTTEDSGKGQQTTHQYFIDKGWLIIEPLTYMRGRSIPQQFLLIDEAQNLTPHEIKSIITRAGHGTKVVLTGDPNQIDHPYLDASTNGISYLVKRMSGQHLFGHVNLTKGERSDLAELASNLL